ncbi:nuclear transport factor 2 family protein [Xanthomonas campestris]|uniref:nuclear transport factor 2 family protein n=1 Tax=Xanthomonas campestris TaxID=339 RepID=UPI003CF3009A
MNQSTKQATTQRTRAAADTALRAVADAFIAATNTFHTEEAVALFASNGVIDDPSTGHVFTGHDGIRNYIQRYFVGYNTISTIVTARHETARRIRLRVDFTGDFGHEIGLLVVTVNDEGLVMRIDAALE